MCASNDTKTPRMTIMEHGGLDKHTEYTSKSLDRVTQNQAKDVCSLHESTGHWSSTPAALTTDAVPSSSAAFSVPAGRHDVPASGPFSAPPTSGWLKKPKKEPQEDTDLSQISPTKELGGERAVVGGAPWMPERHVNHHASSHLTNTETRSPSPVRHRFVDTTQGSTYTFDRVQNVQLAPHSTMVVNVYPTNTRRHATTTPKKRYTITNSKRILSDSNRQMLSSRLGKNWRSLARGLGFHDGDIDRLEFDHRDYGLQEIIWRMLGEWKEREAEAATLCSIADELIKLKLYTIAQDLKEDG